MKQRNPPQQQFLQIGIFCRRWPPALALVLAAVVVVAFLPRADGSNDKRPQIRHHPQAQQQYDELMKHSPPSIIANAYVIPDAISIASTATGVPQFLTGVAFVAAVNILINALRPDPGVIWQLRFPRILWELCILVTATSVNDYSSSSSVYLLIFFMLGTTALLDIFWWAPFFSLWAGLDNEDCSGGGWFSGLPRVCRTNYAKGYGRLLVTMQSLFGGMFYLSSAISAWSEYHRHRDQRKAAQHAMMFQEWMKHQHVQQAHGVKN